MTDSDEDNENSAENELAVFQDEIRGTLCSSLSDKTTFRSLIAEVEHLRNAYKQDPASLNKAVLKGLFELPFSTTSNQQALPTYFKRMGELFDQYSPLIKSLKRDKKTQQEGGIAVAEPLIQLLHSGKLSLNEWSLGEAKTGLAKLLTQHSIIAESQIAIAINAIEGAFAVASPTPPPPPQPPPEDTAVRGAAASAAASATKPSCEYAPRSPHLKRKHAKELSTVEFSGKFTSAGGKLHWWMSDDYLEIPEGAIPEGREWTIYGKIHTSLDYFTHLLKKKKGECFVAAINDYHVVRDRVEDKDRNFEKPVKVVIHHSVCNPLELASLCIQLLDDKHGVIDVPYHAKKIAGLPWYEVDGPRISVYTYHFTKIMCKICDSQECSVKAIKSLVYGTMTTADNKFFATIEIYLHFMRNVENLPVFSEVFDREQNSTGCKLLKAKSFPPSLRLIAPADKISVNLNCTDSQWSVLEDSDFLKKEITVGDNVPCLTEAYDPVCIGTYLLKGSVPSLTGNITLTIGGSHVVKLPLIMKLDGATAVNELQVSRSPSEWILQDVKLYDIAKKLKYETWYEVGLKLGLESNELDHLAANNSHESVERRIFSMLRMWRDRQPRNGEQELKSMAVLCDILRKTTNKAALDELEQAPKKQTIDTAQELAAYASATDSASGSSKASDDQSPDKFDDG